MRSNIKHGLWAKYKLGKEELIGVVEDAGDDLYWFNTMERLQAKRADLLLGEDDITLLEVDLFEEDIEFLIELSLQVNDKMWFEELTSKRLNIIK
ncbi:hypothetical protein [Sporosarcina sp. FSL W7-1283]|uniref:hypothetical protein n=1 Tax=Sporosarcina sp. FSL W7-1283 TaxID=2921560 RepID=UPI0030F6E52C